MEEKVLEILKLALKLENVDESCAQANCEKWDSLKHLELMVETGSASNVELGSEEIVEMKNFKGIKRILQGKQMGVVRFVNSVFESNTYLIRDDYQSQCYLVDCGDPEPILEELQRFDLEFATIFITHPYFDYIYGLNEVVSNVPFVKVYFSLYGKEGLLSNRLSMSRCYSAPFIYRYDGNIEVIENNCIIPLFGRDEMQTKTYETPGHDWGVCCFQINNYLFIGDSYLPQHKVVTTSPRSNRREAEKSLECIRKIAVGCNPYSGHGEIIYA